MINCTVYSVHRVCTVNLGNSELEIKDIHETLNDTEFH